ncbi:Mu transposase C-terminal domain-containing protein [Caballeronia sp. LZ001]|uniref:Mu transposase C-terminal domain-containing protein n=1 Tax=Caballeronia sp. LZ001 TaxID=3038553 RepID=UPI00285DF078|nr:Mu transposase C-terminal domain-containing protein [Caballeronia sp. LZ001]MDR5803430.1 Mu transposase C-terminal domain-containing protein [Caballeronia sp. LZ001]
MDRQAKHAMFKITRDALRHGGAMTLLGWDAFIQFCQEQFDAYNERPHSSLPVIRDAGTGKRRHMSPNEQWAKHVADGWTADTLDEHDVRLVFRPRIKRTVARGEVRLLNHHYSSPALVEFHGDEVQVAYDINDSRAVWVYALDGRYICQADAGANERDYMPQSAIEHAREKRADARATRLQTKLQEVEAERRGRKALDIETPEVLQIEGFGEISRASIDARLAGMPVIDATESSIERPIDIQSAEVFEMPETPAQRFERWQQLDQLVSDGGLPENTDDLRWYGLYPQSKEFAAQKRRAEEAGEWQLASNR